MGDQLVPQIRFDGFDGKWVVDDLGSIAEMYQPETISGRDFAEYGFPVFGANGYIGRYTEANHWEDQVTVSARGAVGIPSYVPAPVWITGNSMVIRVMPSKRDKRFLYYSLQAGRAALQRVSAGGVQQQLTREVLRTVGVSGTTLPEQKRIASLLANLDTSIDQRRRRHEQLKQTKTSLMERMFPSPGETVPQIRFDGFDDEWSEHHLRELGVAKTGFGFPHEAQGGRTGIPFFKVSDMNLPENTSTMQVANHYVTSGQVVRHGWQPVVDVPAILFAKVGAAVFLGRKRTVHVPFLMDNNMMAFCVDLQRWDATFARVVFDSLDLSKLVQVGALPSFNPPQLHDMVVTVPPTLAEQQAIGAFFAKVDALIEAEQHHVEKLQQVKAALLQKMFV